MRGKKAKAMRKMVYGDMSQRQERKYKQVFAGNGRIIFNDPEGLRWRYQHLKQAYRKGLYKFRLVKEKPKHGSV